MDGLGADQQASSSSGTLANIQSARVESGEIVEGMDHSLGEDASHIPEESLDDVWVDEDEVQGEGRVSQLNHESEPQRKRTESPTTATNTTRVSHEPNEPDTCRICSFPAEPGMPLYHPCKCSGTIKYVHQDCLKSWLDTSRRTKCDVCHHTFTYRKVYSPEMPPTLPARVLIGSMLKHVAKWAAIILRVLLVGTIWLAVLPAMLYWCWKVGFWLSDYVSLRVSGKLYYVELYNSQLYNLSNHDPDFVMPSTSFSSSLLESLVQEPTLSSTAAPVSTIPSVDPFVSAISSPQSFSRPTGTSGTGPTLHPSASAIASIFSHASIMQSNNNESQRASLFLRPRRKFPNGDSLMLMTFEVAKKLFKFLSGWRLEPDASLPLDLVRFPYYVVARLGEWLLFVPLSVYRHIVGSILSPPTLSNSTTTTWQQAIEDITVPIVSGQIIAVIIVVAFVSLFFLREWVMANADAGRFGNDQPAPVAQMNEGVDGANGNPPAAAPAGDVPRIEVDADIDIGLAEPRPPSPNIISLKEQEELMKEVSKRRLAREIELEQKAPAVEQWQFGKREALLEGWREYKMKELQQRGQLEEVSRLESPPLNDIPLPMPSTSALPPEPIIKWDQPDYNITGAFAADAEQVVEHIEVSPNRSPIHEDNSQYDDLIPMSSSPEARAGTLGSGLASSSLMELATTLDTPESSAVLPAFFANHAGSSMPLETLEDHSTSSPLLLPTFPSPHTTAASASQLNAPFSGDKKYTTGVIEGSIELSKAATATASTIEPGVKWLDTVHSSHLDFDLRAEAAPYLREEIERMRVSRESRKLLNPPPSVFATLVPPAPPFGRLQELPFSVRDPKVAPESHPIPSLTQGLTSGEPGASNMTASTSSLKSSSAGSSILRTIRVSDSDEETGTPGRRVPRQTIYGKWPSPRQNAKRFSPNRYQERQNLLVSPTPRRPNQRSPLLYDSPIVANEEGDKGLPSSLALQGQRISADEGISAFEHSHVQHTLSSPILQHDPSASSQSPKTSRDSLSHLGTDAPPSSESVDQRCLHGSASLPNTPRDDSERPILNPMVKINSPALRLASRASAPIRRVGSAASGSSFLQSNEDDGFSYHSTQSAPRTNARPFGGHKMGMGMSVETSTNPLRNDSPSVASVTRSRAVTIGGASSSPRHSPAIEREKHPVVHHRSSSLVAQRASTRPANPEANHLLRNESPQPKQPVPWYGFPDPRREAEREIERRKLREWESREKRRLYLADLQRKADSMDSTSLRRKDTILPVQKATSSPELVAEIDPVSTCEPQGHIQETRLQEDPECSPQVGTPEASVVAPMQTSSFANLGITSTSSTAILNDDAQQPSPRVFPDIQSVQIRSGQDSNETPNPNIGVLCSEPASDSSTNNASFSQKSSVQTSQLSRLPKDGATVNARTRHLSPGIIELPIQTIGYEEDNKSLKRPSLPLAASPIASGDRSPTAMALYQPPEEVRDQLEEEQKRLDELDPTSRTHAASSGEERTFHDPAPTTLDIVGASHPLPIPETPPNPVELEEPNPVPDAAAAVNNEAPDQINNADENAPNVPAPAEEVWEDEWGHMLEAVGVIGPWHSIVQHAALVMVIFNVTLGVGVFLPYVAGKATSLLFADPSVVASHLREFNDRPRFFNLQFPPLWSSSPSISIVGKGFTILFGDLSSVVVNALSDASDTVVSAIGRWMPQTVDITGLQNSSPGLTYRVWSALKPSTLIAGTFDLILSSIRWYQQNSSCTMASKSSYSFANAFAIIDHAICSCYPDLLATYPRFKDLMAYLAISSVQNIVADRSSAIIFGYLISLGWIAAHNLLTARHNPYLVFILLKVGGLVIVEAIGKPLAFGIIIDLFTLSLFPGATVKSRVAFFNFAPYSSLSQHWLLGNVAIVQLLHSLGDIQKFLRPGALWRIQRYLDPSPPSIRDMINRSIWWHSLRFFVTLFSGIMILWLTIGLTVDVNNAITSNFAPLRWNSRRALSEVPFDLLLLHIFVPATFRFLRLKKVAKSNARAFVIECSRYLNLQNVLFDERTVSAPIDTAEGTFWRVPVTDGAIQLAGRPYAIQTDISGNGISQEDRDMIDMQLIASEKAMRNPNNDYRVIFFPHNFLFRLVAFVAVSWMAFFFGVWTAITLPVQIGRLTFKVSLGLTDVHDAYCWLAGLYLFWIGSFGNYLLVRERRRWSKYLKSRSNHRFTFKLFVAHTATMLFRLVFSVVLLILVLPALVGLVFEIYMVLPLSYHLYPGQTPTLRLVDAWAAGLIIGAIALRLARLVRPNQVPGVFDRIRREGWFKIKVRALASQLALSCVILALLVISPFVLEYLLPPSATLSIGEGHAVLKILFPMLLCLFVSSFLATTVHSALVFWVETVRDERYLAKEIIENMDALPAPIPDTTDAS